MLACVQTGGVIFYCRQPAGQGGHIQLVRHVLVGLDVMYDFVDKLIAQIPPDVGADDAARTTIILPDDLPSPKRIKLSQQLVPPPAMSACELLAKIVSDRDDIACMRDVEDLPMAALSVSSPPPYIS